MISHTFKLIILLFACLLSSCGGSRDQLAQSSDIVIRKINVGPTPFIKFVELHGQSVSNVSSFRFIINPKIAATSLPVDVTFSTDRLKKDGYFSDSNNSITLPVFGLYASFDNLVNLQLSFKDGSIQFIETTISTSAYVDPYKIYDRPNILKRRTAGDEFGFNFFFIKSFFAGPVVVDTDGEVRWVSPSAAAANTFSMGLHDNEFIVGDPVSTSYSRMHLDGRIEIVNFIHDGLTHLHHNIDAGKIGLFGEVGTFRSGINDIQNTLIEFNKAGIILREWSVTDILRRYMASYGDDPSLFIRDGIDWFHMNASTYDASDDSIIISGREDFIIKIDYKSGNLLWILGDPTKYWYSFPSLRAKALTLPQGHLYPIGQHATSVTSKGLLMLFNNGGPSFNQPDGAPIGDSRAYSAVSVYNIDKSRLSASEVSRFDYGKNILSDICSSVYEGDADSVLISYAAADGRTRARLVGVNKLQQVVFDFEYKQAVNSCGTSWNAMPIRLESLRLI